MDSMYHHREIISTAMIVMAHLLIAKITIVATPSRSPITGSSGEEENPQEGGSRDDLSATARGGLRSHEAHLHNEDTE